jgi:peptide/nickel transport system permease protein
VWSRFVRADMSLTLQSDFIMLAKAKGISPRRILWVHALRSSVLSLITSVALQVAALIGGAVVAEQFFGPKGIGDRLVFAIQQNDIMIIQAITAVLVVAVVVVNLLVDLLYAVVDPRIRHARRLG